MARALGSRSLKRSGSIVEATAPGTWGRSVPLAAGTASRL